jgi:bifunctional non-homologous end joining protein LigD
MHVMNCRVDEVDKPDWLAFDLDPSDGFSSAARAALLLRTKLEDHGLEPFVKTSGGRGLHIFVPLRRGAAQERVRAYASAIAGEMAREHPKLVTTETRKAKRRAPVYLDVMRNAPGQTIAPPYSVRWRPRAPVSMPLDWDEVSPPARSGAVQYQDRGASHARKVAVVDLLRSSSNAATRLRWNCAIELR